MTTVPRDYAIYGGRRIGKSSLLSEVKKQLEQKGYVTAYQSFQGFSETLAIARGIVQDLQLALDPETQGVSEIKTLDDFALQIQKMYNNSPDTNVAIFLDEVDELIIREKLVGRHQIIEIFRDMSNKTNHRWRFVFAGFKEMYLEIHGKGMYEELHNPWQNFVDDSNKQLMELESPRELVDEGLHNILGLEYDREVAALIENYSSGHPAFLQKFCQCLIQSIDERISPFERRIYKADVERVFNGEMAFLKYVQETIDLNLSELQKAIIIIAAMEAKERFDTEFVLNKLNEYFALFGRDDLKVENSEVSLQLELLLITGVIKEVPRTSEFRFAHPYYIKILKGFERIDRDALEHVIQCIPSPTK